MTLNLDQTLDLEPDRLMALMDGIFAIAITLLVLGIELPAEVTFGSYVALDHFLISIIPQLGLYVISFVLLSSFWVQHHVFIRVKKVTVPFLWLNIAYLLVIVLIPFTTSIVGSYSQFFDAELTFGVNIFLSLLIFFFIYYYACHTGIIEDKLLEAKKHTYITIIYSIILTIIVGFLGYTLTRSAIYLYLLIPIISIIRDVYHSKNDYL